MKKLFYLLLSSALLAAPACSKKDDPAPTPAVSPTPPPTVTVSLNGGTAAPLTKTLVVGFALGAGPDGKALYSLDLAGDLPNGQGLYIQFYPSLTQPATATGTPLGKITLSKPGVNVESTGQLTGAASNNVATNTASGTFSATLSDGTRVSGSFSGASTKK